MAMTQSQFMKLYRSSKEYGGYPIIANNPGVLAARFPRGRQNQAEGWINYVRSQGAEGTSSILDHYVDIEARIARE